LVSIVTVSAVCGLVVVGCGGTRVQVRTVTVSTTTQSTTTSAEKPPPAAKRTYVSVLSLTPLIISNRFPASQVDGRCFGPYDDASVDINGNLYAEDFIQCGGGGSHDSYSGAYADGRYIFRSARLGAGAKLTRFTALAGIDEQSSSDQYGTRVTWTLLYYSKEVRGCRVSLTFAASDTGARRLRCSLPSRSGDTARLVVRQQVSFAGSGGFWAGLIGPRVTVNGTTRRRSSPGPVSAQPPPPSFSGGVTLRGTGQRVLPLRLNMNGPAVFTANHRGTSNFVIEVKGPVEDLLVNEIGNYQGQTLLKGATSGSYRVAVTADGPWTIKVTQPIPDPAAKAIPLSVSEYGSTVVPIQAGEDLQPIVTASNRGKSNFVVYVVGYGSTTGEELVFNEIGNFHGETLIDDLPAGPYLVSVQSDGYWSLKFTM
jgi:hypothetical protein